MVDFGNRLKTLRVQNKYTQMQLADRIGVTKSVISAYENGFRMPSYDVLISIANIFKVSTDFLLGREQQTGIDLSGLTEGEILALKKLIREMQKTV